MKSLWFSRLFSRQFSFSAGRCIKFVQVRPPVLDESLNHGIEDKYFSRHEYRAFVKRFDLNDGFEDTLGRIIKVPFDVPDEYSDQLKDTLKGFYLTREITSEIFVKNFKDRLPASLIVDFIDILSERNVIYSFLCAIGLSEAFIAENSWLKESYSIDDVYNCVVASTASLSDIENDKTDFLSDFFYRLVYHINQDCSRDKVVNILENFYVPHYTLMNWDEFVKDTVKTDAYIKLLAALHYPGMEVRCEVLDDYNPTLVLHQRADHTCYIFAGDTLIAKGIHSYPEFAKYIAKESALIKLVNQCLTN